MPLWKGTEVERQHFGGLNKIIKNARIVMQQYPVPVRLFEAHHSSSTGVGGSMSIVDW